MKLFWMGTDSLMLKDYSMRAFLKKVYWWIFRRFIRVADYFIDAHYCVSEKVADNVREFGTRKPIKIVQDQCDVRTYKKKAHEGFNVLYYFPSGGDIKFNKWLYGYDIFLQVKELFPEINFIVVDGTYNMKMVYPFVDFYLRCNRHDGHSRIIMECDINNIPYYWSIDNPSISNIKKVLYEFTSGPG